MSLIRRGVPGLEILALGLVMIQVFDILHATPLQAQEVDGFVNAATCGVNKYGAAQDKIVGGHEARRHAYPWLVSLWAEDDYYETDSHQCGAVVINSRFLLTAAHCFLQYDKASIWKALLGEHDFTQEEGTEVWRKVEKLIIHENYDPYESRNDIAIVKLAEPLDAVPTEDLSINTICLPKSDDNFAGMKCKVAGWGRLRDYGELPSVLQEVELPVFGWEKCNTYRFYNERVWKTNLCAGFDEGGKDSCQGDSGGPLMCAKSDGKFYLSGIVSWGMGCAMKNSPGVYTDPTKYLDWISKILQNNS